MFFGPSAFQLRSKINKKPSPGRSKIKQKIYQHLDPIFDRFLIQLGSNLAPKMDQIGPPNRVQDDVEEHKMKLTKTLKNRWFFKVLGGEGIQIIRPG